MNEYTMVNVCVCTVKKDGTSDQKKLTRAQQGATLRGLIRYLLLDDTGHHWYVGAQMVALAQGTRAALVSDVLVAGMPLVLTGKPVEPCKPPLLRELSGDLLLQISRLVNRVLLSGVCRDMQQLLLSAPRSPLALRVKSMDAPFAFFGVLLRMHARYDLHTVVLRDLHKWADPAVFALEQLLRQTLRITTLDVSSNKSLTRHWHTITCCAGLRVLRMTRCSMSSQGLAKTIRDRPWAGVTHLDMQGFRCPDSPDYAPQLAQLLRACPRLETLNLADVGDLGPDFVGVAGALGGLSQLRELDVSRMRLGPVRFLLLLRGLQGCPKLEKLTAQQFGVYLQTQHDGPATPFENLDRIPAALGDLSSLKTLDLAHNPLGAVGSELAKQLGRLSGLRRLDLGDCGLCSGGAEALCWTVFRTCPLTHICLSTNDIEGTHTLKPAIDTCRSLKSVDLRDNRFDASDFAFFAKMVRRMTMRWTTFRPAPERPAMR